MGLGNAPDSGQGQYANLIGQYVYIELEVESPGTGQLKGIEGTLKSLAGGKQELTDGLEHYDQVGGANMGGMVIGEATTKPFSGDQEYGSGRTKDIRAYSKGS